MSARILAALLAAFALTAGDASGLPKATQGGYTPLQQAREEAGAGRPLPRMELLPAGLLRLSETELLAATGQTLGFTVTLDRDVEAARLELDLPSRWVARSGISDLRAAKVPSTGRRARRAGRTVSFAFDGGKAGDEASFELTDVGIPAGEYDLSYRWTERGGKSVRGSTRVRFYAPTREAQAAPESEWSRIASPGVERNATNDAVTESETYLTVVPGNRKRFVVGANGGPGDYNAWITNDGGQTFTLATMPAATDAPGEATPETSNVCCDPMSAADEAGNIWYGGLSQANGAGNPSRIVINRFAPGETTFQPLTTGLAARTSGTQDKPMMSIDNSPSSPRYGRLYVVWNEPQGGGIKIVISQCDTRPGGTLDAARCDNADNWTAPTSVTPLTGSYIYADVGTGPDGTVYVVWWDYSMANAIRGDACAPAANCATGAAWGTLATDAQTIATLDATGGQPIPFACPIVAQPGGRASTAPGVDVDRSGGANNGRVYVTWSDLRTGSGTTRCSGGQSPQTSHLTFDNFVASAVNALPGGASPSPIVATRLLTDGEGGGQANSDDWFSWLAVDQTTGQAWADFYSTRDDGTRKTTHFYVRSVTPSGGTSHTLGALNKVSAQPSDYSTAACCGFGNDYGDYSGIDATQGMALPVWSDKRGGLDGEAFTYVKAEPAAVAGIPVIDDALGDADGVLEPGERFALTQPVRNDGSAGATAVTATLDGGTDIATEQATSAYPDMAIGATVANATPYTGSVRADLGCGAPARGTLRVVSAEADNTVPVTLPTGTPGPAQEFNADPSPDAPIPDATGAALTSQQSLSGIAGLLTDLDVRINVTHTFVADLSIRLEAPDGTQVALVQGRGGAGDNFVNTVFDDEAGQAISAGAAPFTGSFRPEAPLSALDGVNPNGTWKLILVDSEGGDFGTLNSWRLSARGATCSTVPDAPVLTGTDPASPAADTTPVLRGTAPDGTTVRLYTGGACTGTPAATGTAADLASAGFEVTVPARSTTQIRATAANGGFTSVCSPALEYVESSSDEPVPTVTAAPTVVATPGPKAVDKSVDFTLSATATQRALKAKGIKLAVVCATEPCTASASGVLTIKRKKLTTGTAKKTLKAKEKATLTLKLSKSLTRKLKAALRKKKARVSAKLTVVVTDAAGNKATKSVTVKLKR